MYVINELFIHMLGKPSKRKTIFLAAREQLNNVWCVVSEWVSECLLSSVVKFLQLLLFQLFQLNY